MTNYINSKWFKAIGITDRRNSGQSKQRFTLLFINFGIRKPLKLRICGMVSDCNSSFPSITTIYLSVIEELKPFFAFLCLRLLLYQQKQNACNDTGPHTPSERC